ncbi:MAG: hypothetical protein MRJ65_13190 [Candidatus Brocadiaceae bacterium]|nr:hypothetical protein [Candidatus Brocadiaceae bacterium]
MVEDKRGNITFEYKVSPNYSVYAINGIQGGFNAQGDLVANLFYERSPIPRKITHALMEDESLGEEINRDSANAIIRHVMFGLSFNPRIARHIAKWFSNKADEYERAVGNMQFGGNNE